MEEPKMVSIMVHDKRVDMTGSMYVEQLDAHTFRAVENELFNPTITIGTEFLTRFNQDGHHEIVKITKMSPYTTRRFLLSQSVPAADYQLLGDEITRQGGYWQVDMGGIASVSLPVNCPLDLDEIFRIFNHWPTEIKDED
ncbi:hypothetical protein [Taibaiella koreensis]|uniref:hypothetical protein n=1 Tax=Taibaiella koreensis TaxID=1268548 RepID=UPI000E59B64A|nr:hypothetical protein [Taibaiella koreensis]